MPQDEERRARSTFHRRRFNAFLARVRAMPSPDAVYFFELSRVERWPRFSSALEWPTLRELLPAVAGDDLERLARRARELNDAARRLVFHEPNRRVSMTKANLADLKISFPEFSDSARRKALNFALWDTMW